MGPQGRVKKRNSRRKPADMARRVSTSPGGKNDISAVNAMRSILIETQSDLGQAQAALAQKVAELAGAQRLIAELMSGRALQQAEARYNSIRCNWHGYDCDYKARCSETTKTRYDEAKKSAQKAEADMESVLCFEDGYHCATKVQCSKATKKKLDWANTRVRDLENDLNNADEQCPYGSDHQQFYSS